MDDVRVMPGPGIPRGLVVPAHEIVEVFSHASGPGGQGVNTTDSRVQLSFDVTATRALSEEQRARVLVQLAGRLSGGVLMISAAEHRSQLRNRTAARERLAEMLREALKPDMVRRATRPSRGSKQRRLTAKRERSETKQGRRRPSHD